MRPHGWSVRWFVALLALTSVASAQAPVVLGPDAASIPLDGHIAVLRDETGRLTLDDVRSPALDRQFRADPRWRLNFGFDHAPYWYRLVLRNGDPTRAAEWVLYIANPLVDYLDIHVLRAGAVASHVLAGDLRPPSPLQLRARAYATPLVLAGGEEVTLYVRAQTEGQHIVPVALWSRTGFTEQWVDASTEIGFYLGIVFVMALYNFVVFVWLRDRAYLWYSAFLASTIAFGLVTRGFARSIGHDALPEAPRLLAPLYPMLQALAGAMLIMFVREFLETRRHAPRWDLALRVLAGAAALRVALAPVVPYHLINEANTLFVALEYTALFALGVYLSYRRVRAAHFFMAAWFILFVFTLLSVLAAVQVIPSSYWTAESFGLGMATVVVMLSAALADRVLQERKEKFAARENARRLESFLPQKVAELVGSGDGSLLEPRRRNVTVCVIDLRGFTPLSETAAPEEVMSVLREFYDSMGRIVEGHAGTVEHFAGDSMLIFFNAPLETPEPEKQAVQTALEMRTAFETLRARWAKRGHELGLGVGIADGYATIGAIGFSGRSQYAAIGAVTNLASRLCSAARHGEILTTGRVLAAVETAVEAESAGEQQIRGFSKPVQVVRIVGARPGLAPPPAIALASAT